MICKTHAKLSKSTERAIDSRAVFFEHNGLFSYNSNNVSLYTDFLIKNLDRKNEHDSIKTVIDNVIFDEKGLKDYIKQRKGDMALSVWYPQNIYGKKVYRYNDNDNIYTLLKVPLPWKKENNFDFYTCFQENVLFLLWLIKELPEEEKICEDVLLYVIIPFLPDF